MAYLVTGATGCIGRYLVPELLRRNGEVFVLVPPGADSANRFDWCAREWAGGDRVRPVHGDLGAPMLGLEPDWIAAHRGCIEHVIHLGAGWDAGPVGGGTGAVVEAAAALEVGLLHHVSTVEVAGSAAGVFTEDMFDVGQVLLTPHQRAAFETERVVREQCAVPWRIYRPSIVIGHSRTGELDRIAGPYHFFRLLRSAAEMARILPLVVPKLGETNMVPVDFVTKALDHIAHRPGPAGGTFHLVDRRRQSAADVLNLFAEHAGAPHLVETMPKPTLEMLLRLPGLGWVLRRLGVPQEVVQHSQFGCWFDSRNATAALAGTDIKVPPLAAYAPVIWKYWIENWV